MIFIALLIYLLFWFPYRTFLVPILPITDPWRIAIFPLLYFISFSFAYAAAYFVYYYAPELKKPFHETIKVHGVKFLSFGTFIAAGIIFFYLLFSGVLLPLHVELLLPIAAVSLLNSINVEIIPGILKDIEKEGRKIRPLEKPDIPADRLRQFLCNHNGQEYKLSVRVSYLIFQQAKSKTRLNRSEWAREYVANGITGEVRCIAGHLLQTGKQLASYEEVSLALSLVQSSIEYESDGDEEWPKYPVESLYDGKGDCEDFAILGAAILKVMGYDVALLFLPGHAALGVAGADEIPGDYIEHDSRRYYYCKMTGDGWQIGELPEEYKEEKIEVQPVPEISIKTRKATQSQKED
jgi:hypothetical protein